MAGIAAAVGKIFGMFDKIDDIVYEPVKLLCDALRQPLKQIDHKNEKDKAEHDQALQISLKQFEADLEQEQKDRDMNRTIEQQRLEEEIRQMIMDNDLARREKMIQLEAQYRKDMALAAAELEQIIINITVDSRDKIIKLYKEHKKAYIEVQNAYTDAVYANVARMKELFPDHSGDAAILEYMIKYIEQISQESTEFSKQLNKDMESVLSLTIDTTRETTGLASRYLAPAAPNTPAITENVAGAIE
ncbi:hypothetical protein [Ruminococcus sp.]|uniref:hypothetical protein n=1 Tax=Ruminococcus sp. TaxID=41978 RepID=UPI001B2D4E38|nr:hypothetical protein [Ruminococcus sp.]MBO5557237.1 hypothetical protein [Ruminococcus sp.]